MVEWWKTTDELAYKVTAALHKQMDRKKRPGWVRGDAFDIESSHAEILTLNKLVRELQEENANLKSRVVDRVPKLVAGFILDDVLDTDKQNDSDDKKSIEDECRSHGELVQIINENSIQIRFRPIYVDQYRNRYEPLDRSYVDPHLNNYVSDEALRQYNEALPTREMVDTYINELKAYERICKGGVAFQLEISNNGTAKATDIRVLIDFPEEFLLFKITDIKGIKKPPAPKLPKNPIKLAEEEYIKHMHPMATAICELNRQFNQFNALPNYEFLHASIPNSYVNTINKTLVINEHDIIAETQQIPHRDLQVFEDIYVVPTARGKFKVKVSLMCSEYLEPMESYIDVEIV